MGLFGCFGSRKRRLVYTINHDPTKQKVYDTCTQKLGLSNDDIDKFWTVFNEIDKSHDGTISASELINYLQLDVSPFNEKIFRVMDNGDGKLGFLEFTLSVLKYGVQDRMALTALAFKLYDTDDSGQLSMDEIQKLLSHIYGGNPELTRVQTIAKSMDLNKDGLVSLGEFMKTSNTHPLLLHPAHLTHERLREQIMGLAWWERRIRNQSAESAKNVWDLMVPIGPAAASASKSPAKPSSPKKKSEVGT